MTYEKLLLPLKPLFLTLNESGSNAALDELLEVRVGHVPGTGHWEILQLLLYFVSAAPRISVLNRAVFVECLDSAIQE